MRRTAVLTALMGVALLAAALWASSASATVLCKTASNPCTGGTHGKGTTIEASLGSGAEVYFGTWCGKSSIKGEVTSAGAEGANVAGTISALSFSECGTPITVLKKGTFTIQYFSGNNGILTLEGFEVTAYSESEHCIYLGPVQIFLTGNTPASVKVSAPVNAKGCEGSLAWKGSYLVTSPNPLFIAEQAQASTVLCKTATYPCTGGTYGKGTVIEASMKSGHSVLDSAVGKIECGSLIKGEVTGTGGEGADITGTISTFSLTGCTTATVNVLKKGTFTIKSPSGGNGTMVLEGFETTVVTFGLHCIFSGSATFNLKGGGMASLAPNTSLTRTGGASGAFCGSLAPLTGEYTVTAPEPLYVEPSTSVYSVLCKTASNPCTGGTHGKGTAIEAILQNGLTIDSSLGDIECRNSSIKGEVSKVGEETGAPVTISISTLSFGECNASVSVLKNGTFSVTRTGKGDGALSQTGSEITINFLGFHCIYGANNTALGTIKGGYISTIQVNPAMPRTGGTSGSFCGSSSPWTAEYALVTPSPLYVEES